MMRYVDSLGVVKRLIQAAETLDLSYTIHKTLRPGDEVEQALHPNLRSNDVYADTRSRERRWLWTIEFREDLRPQVLSQGGEASRSDTWGASDSDGTVLYELSITSLDKWFDAAETLWFGYTLDMTVLPWADVYRLLYSNQPPDKPERNRLTRVFRLRLYPATAFQRLLAPEGTGDAS